MFGECNKTRSARPSLGVWNHTSYWWIQRKCIKLWDSAKLVNRTKALEDYKLIYILVGWEEAFLRSLNAVASRLLDFNLCLRSPQLLIG